MSTQDISQLIVEVKSTGIQTAANQLDKLTVASEKAEAAVKKLGSAVVNSQSSTATSQAQASTSSVNAAAETAKQLISIAQKRDIEIYNSRTAAEARIKALQEKRDTESWQAAVAQAEKIKSIQERRDVDEWSAAQEQAAKIKAIQEKRDIEIYEERVASATRTKALQEKRDMEEWESATSQAAKIKAIQEKRDIEIYESRVAQTAKLGAIQEKRDMEEWTAAQSETSRLKALEEKRDIELYEMRVAANARMRAEDERQRSLNVAFQTSSVSSQIAAATKAQAYSAAGGDATAKFGSAASTADIAALTAQQAALKVKTAEAKAAQGAQNLAFAEANALSRGLAGSLGALWVTYGNLAGMAVGIALGVSLKNVITIGSQLEQTLEGIRVLGGATTDEMTKMADAVYSLGKGVNGPREVAEALKTLTLAGLNADQALQGLGAALNLSIGGEVSIEKSAETLVQVGTALGYTADGFDHVSDVIVKTAAASMSSVDSISGAFKSAAAVGLTYGASLQDIALGLAAVANLGIQGTAAGTALKNLYKDLSASTEKVTGTLKAMHMTTASFRDTEGFMLPLVEVIQKLDAGLGTLDAKARNFAMVKLFGQQGLREGAALIGMLHQAATDTERYGTKVDATHNKLVELQDQIKESAGVAALAAIAMAQTTSNQFKAIKNTLEVTFSQVFSTIQPQIGQIARALQQAFASEDFKEGLKTIIGLVTDFTRVLFDNAAILRDIALGIAGAKLLEMAAGFRVAAISAGTFMAALGPIALVITGLTLAWQTYKTAKDRALSNKDAEGNLADFASNVEKEAKKEVELYDLRMKYGSDVDAQRTQEANERKEASQKAVDDARKGTNALLMVREEYWQKLSEGERKKATEILKLDTAGQQAALDKRKFLGMEGLFDHLSGYIRAERAYGDAQKNTADLIIKTTLATEKFTEARAKNDKLTDAAAKKNTRIVSTGDGELPVGKGSNGADAYAASLAEFTNDIKAANQALEQARESANSAFKAGEIGKLQLINKVADAEIQASRRVAEDARSAAAVAAGHVGKDGKADKTADAERFRAEAERADKDAEQADRMRAAGKVEFQRATLTEITKMKVKSLEEEGKYVEAASLKWSSDGKMALEQAQKDLKAYGDEFPWLSTLVNQFAENRNAAMNSAQLKEDVTAFDTSLLTLQSTLKGFKSASYGTSLDTMLDSATKASDKFDGALAVSKEKLESLLNDAALTNSPEAWKKYAEGVKELGAAADGIKTKWQEVADTISSSLSNAFGKPGKALGDLRKAMLEYKNTENATASDRMKQYGDMAQAASGFFDKQSKGYKALNAISQVFHVAQMARTLAQTAASVIAGVANFFGQSGWGGFAGVAAMGAVLAGVGYTMAGGSSHADPTMDAEYVQKHQGTGSVLGDADAKSESISKSIEALKSNSDAMLPISTGMLSALKNIESAMVGVAKLAIQNGVTNGSNFDVKVGQLNAKGSATDLISKGLTHITDAMFGPVVGGKLASIANNLWGRVKAEISDSGLQVGGKVSDIQAGNGVNQYAAVKTTQSSWFGLAKDSNTKVMTQGVGDEMSKQFGLIFTNLEDVMKAAAPALGASASAIGKQIEDSAIATTKISLKDLKGDELASAINNVISQAMDSVAKAAYPQMEAFQKVGEGLAQTVVRVASGIEQANVGLAALGVTAINYTQIINKQGDVATEIVRSSIAAKEGLKGVGTMILAMSDDATTILAAYKNLVDIRQQMENTGMKGDPLNAEVVNGAGGISNLKQAMQSYEKSFFTEAEQNTMAVSDLAKSFQSLGLAVPATKAEFKGLISTLNMTGDSKMLGSVLALADAFASVTDKADALTEAQAKAAVDANKAKEDAQAKAAATLASALELQSKIAEATGDTALARAVVLQQRASELQSLDSVLQPLQLRVWMLEDEKTALDALKKTATDAFETLKNSVQAQKDAMNAAYDDQVTAANTAATAATDAAQAQLDAANDVLKAIGSIFDNLTNALKSTQVESATLDRARRLAAQKYVEDQSGKDLTKSSGLSDALEQLAKPSEQMFSTFEDYAFDQAKTNVALQKLQTQAGQQKTLAQQTVDKLTAMLKEISSAKDSQLLVLSTSHKEDTAHLDALITDGQSQLNALNGINTSVLSVKDALAQFATAISAAVGTKTQQEAERSTPSPVQASNSAADVALQNAAQQINGLYQSLLGRSAEKSAVTNWAGWSGQGGSISDLVNSVMNSDEFKALHPAVAGITTGANGTPQVTVPNANGTTQAYVPPATGTAQANVPAAVTTQTPAPTPAYTGTTQLSKSQMEIEGVYRSMLGRVPDAGAVDSWAKWEASGGTVADLVKSVMGSDEYKHIHPSFDVGTNSVPNDMLANIHKGERIIPAADNAELMRRLDKDEKPSSDNHEIVAAIKELQQIIISGDIANVKRASELLKLYKKWDNNGMPSVRDTTV